MRAGRDPLWKDSWFSTAADGQGITATYQRLAGEQHLPFLDFFANENLNHYKHFIQAKAVFLGRFNKYLVPD